MQHQRRTTRKPSTWTSESSLASSASRRHTCHAQPIDEEGVAVAEYLLAAHTLELLCVREKLHEVQQTAPAGWLLFAVAMHEFLPALLRTVAVFGLHGRTLRSVVQRQLLRRERPCVIDLPQAHALPEREGQLRTVARITQNDLGVGPGRTDHGLVPLHFVLRAHLLLLVPLPLARRPCDSRVVGALGQGVVEHVQDGRDRLVAEGKVPMVVGPGLAPVAHANDLVPHRSAEYSFTTGHEEPHDCCLRMSPRLAVESVHVAHEGGMVTDHLLPVVIEGTEQDRGDVHGHTTIPSQQGVHQGILLVCREQLLPFHRQLDLVHVLLNLVHVHDLEIETAFVPLDALAAQLDDRGQRALL
mmetsp:Transcript_82175/g.227956  ORF Transcript_82175/g.227956 Transcript_82175/m.227956 type:complete len:357 (+) Transcript_82175:107-1177(+)